MTKPKQVICVASDCTNVLPEGRKNIAAIGVLIVSDAEQLEQIKKLQSFKVKKP